MESCKPSRAGYKYNNIVSDAVAHSYNPSSSEAEMGGSQVPGEPQQLCEALSNLATLKIKKKKCCGSGVIAFCCLVTKKEKKKYSSIDQPQDKISSGSPFHR